MRKILVSLIAILLALPLWAAKPYTVVIDAGHGGKDPGAVGHFSYEKDLNLTLALRTGKLLRERFPDVRVVYTRANDTFIPLQTRADIANKNNARKNCSAPSFYAVWCRHGSKKRLDCGKTHGSGAHNRLYHDFLKHAR